MPFTWTAGDVPEDVRTVDDGAGGKRLNPITQTIVFATMSVGMPRITEQNAREFYARVSIWEKLMGAGTHDADLNPIYISTADVRAHIGVSTNANAMTTPQFRKFVFDKAASHALAGYDTAAELAASAGLDDE
jgi:hypothetical protein